MPSPIRVLFVEDLDYEADLAMVQLRKAGIDCSMRRVETAFALRAALADYAPSIILSDFSLPEFDGLSALQIAREVSPDTPFIFLSGTIGEERAINALHSGAVDYVLKGNIARLAPAVTRALADVESRMQRRRQEQKIARLNRVLKMLSGINGLVLRIKDKTELLRETCRLAVSGGGYTAAMAALKTPGASALTAVGWSGASEKTVDALKETLGGGQGVSGRAISQVMKQGKAFVCNDTTDFNVTTSFNSKMLAAGLHSVAMLPLMIDGTPIGILMLVAVEADVIKDEEFGMLQEVAGNLSFGLQYLQTDTKVRFLSHFDPQTGLAKRALFCERVSRVLADQPNRSGRYAIAVIDIERLNVINDSFGRRVGDLLLQHVADRMKRRFPQTEQIAHFGGGTFALWRDLGTKSLAEVVATANEHVAAVFGQPFSIEKMEIPIGIKSGIAFYPEDGTDANVLVQNAEAALHNARTTGERQFHYSAEKHAAMLGMLAMEHKLRLALDRQQFELFYQPKVNVITRRVQGVEALIRWHDPDQGIIAPGAFLPLLESTGLIVDVSRWVIEQAARDCQEWMKCGLPPVRIAVNISPSQLRLQDFSASFLGAIRPWSTPEWGLDIEITEGALHEDSATEIRKLKVLRAAGVKIAIDDFGTGYSSLSRLSSLPIDTLKIDRSFIKELPDDAASKTLVKSIVSLARAFRMNTVAEGVETQEQLNFLWQAGCDQSQGYFHSRPVPRKDLADVLEHGKGIALLPPEPAGGDGSVMGIMHGPTSEGTT